MAGLSLQTSCQPDMEESHGSQSSLWKAVCAVNRSGHKGWQKAVRLVIWMPEAVEALAWQAATERVSAGTWAGHLLAEAAGDFWENHEAVTAGEGRVLHATATWNEQKGLVSLTWAPMERLHQAHHGPSQSAPDCP